MTLHRHTSVVDITYDAIFHANFLTFPGDTPEVIERLKIEQQLCLMEMSHTRCDDL